MRHMPNVHDFYDMNNKRAALNNPTSAIHTKKMINQLILDFTSKNYFIPKTLIQSNEPINPEGWNGIAPGTCALGGMMNSLQPWDK